MRLIKVKKEGTVRRSRRDIFLALLLIVLGIGGFAAAHKLQHPTPPPIAKLKAPDLTQPSKLTSAPTKQAVSTYTVAPTLPKFISIPAIGIPSTEILTLGTAADGAIATPSSSYVTGWYNQSAKPGQPGEMFIYGHVAGWNNGGIFYNLKHLRPGDVVTITRGDNKVYTYQVVTSKVYPYQSVNMSTVLTPIDPGTPGLSLMTCTGTAVPSSNPLTFTKRLVVYAKLTSAS